ncbi:MAG: TRAP transporter small permease subunit [Pseudomonadota bacterium]|nr:TRAP transporter small permease subunit [Pseudomonadota bacterium]
MQVLKRLRYRLIQVETWLAAGSLFLLLALALLQILARNLFDAGIAEADTLTRYLVLYVTFFGAAVAVERDRHIKIDVCCALLSPAMLRKLYRPMRVMAAVVCAFLADAAIRYWRDEWLYAPDYERWLVLVGLVIPVGFVLLTMQFFLAAILGRDETCCTL